MSIIVRCPSCHASARAPDHATGGHVKCATCGSSMQVPGPHAKVCCVCGEDVANQKRVKDASGHYYCQTCHAAHANWQGMPPSPPPVEDFGTSSSDPPTLDALEAAATVEPPESETLRCPDCGYRYPIVEMNPSGVCHHCATRANKTAQSASKSDSKRTALILAATFVPVICLVLCIGGWILWTSRAQVQKQQQAFEQSKQVYDKLVQMKEQGDDALAAGKLDDATRLYEEVLTYASEHGNANGDDDWVVNEAKQKKNKVDRQITTNTVAQMKKEGDDQRTAGKLAEASAQYAKLLEYTAKNKITDGYVGGLISETQKIKNNTDRQIVYLALRDMVQRGDDALSNGNARAASNQYGRALAYAQQQKVTTHEVALLAAVHQHKQQADQIVVRQEQERRAEQERLAEQRRQQQLAENRKQAQKEELLANLQRKYPNWHGGYKSCPYCHGTGHDLRREATIRQGIISARVAQGSTNGLFQRINPSEIQVPAMRCPVCDGLGWVPDGILRP